MIARWNPLPYAISSTTVTMPHAMPSMRQRRPEPVRDERAERLGDDFAIEPHAQASYRSASTGGSAAAREAG